MRSTRFLFSRSFLMRLMIVLPFLLVCAIPIEAAAQNVEFEPGRWNLKQAKLKEVRGRNCLSGTAFLNGVKLKDGVIDVDLLVTGAQSYPGIIFRRSADGEFERIYLRPHRAGHYPDAVQYTPTFNGSEAWQLYNGSGYTAACDLQPDNWIHLRLEFRDSQARLFIGGSSTPAIVVRDLKHSPVHGSLGLDAPQDGSAYFSRFSYHEDASLDFPPAPVLRTPPGTITRWEISRVFGSSAIDMERTPSQQSIEDPQWMTVESEASGLVNLARYRSRIGQGANCVWARATITAEDEGVRELQFGYSDAVSIFCNGRLLFAGTSAYRMRDPSFLGIAGYFDAVYLPLEEGENELMFCVSDVSGGWGFMARDGDAEYLDPMIGAKWSVSRQLHFPESVVYDEIHDVFYVSNFFNDGEEFISKISPDGDVLALRWASGLKRPTGLAMHNAHLYAVDRTGVAVINTETGVVEKRIEASEAKFLNDIAFDDAGIGYVTDSGANRILRLEGDRLAPWLESPLVGSPNGIHVENGELLIGNSGDATIKAMNLTSKKWRPVATLDPGCVIDGLTGMGDGRLLASDHAGRVFIISPSGEVVKTILDRSTTQRYCADFAYVPALHMLVIPSLQENSLSAYILK